MNEYELRIGNLLQDAVSKSVLVVCKLEIGIVTTIVRDRENYPLANGWRQEPIPLTEEWLVRFGFASSFSSDPQNFPASKQFDLNGFKIHQPIEDVDQFIFDPLINDYIDLKFVHSLQNIYFCLTKKELNEKNRK